MMRINEIFYSLQGEGRHTGTPAVFVRFAGCNLKCSFCDTDHSRYVEMTEEEIVKEVRQFPARFVVITGGEPTANLPLLKRIVDACQKKVYINTTLPKKNLDEVIDYLDNEDKIYGINISRQFGKLNNLYKYVASPEDILKIRTSIRINVMRTKDWIENLDQFIDTWIVKPNVLLNLREDYRYITKENLKVRNDVVDYLANRFVYVGGSGCMVCNGETFVNPETGKYIHYHRGIEHSCVRYADRTYVNDVIIRPDGKVYDDWDWSVEMNGETIKNIK